MSLADKSNQRGRNPFTILTVGFGLYIIISASFMQQVWRFIGKMVGMQNLQLFCIVLNLVIALVIILQVSKAHFSLFRIAIALLVVIYAAFFAWRQPYFVEKMHVLEYGALGWLATRDLGKHFKGVVKVFIFSWLFVLCIAAFDEGFQRLLPYRVGEVRDVITDLASGSFGIALYLLKR